MPADVASWIELDAGAVARNLEIYRSFLGETKLGGVLKGNAYGHGLQEMLPLVHPRVDVIYVITAEDALAIRSWESQSGAERRPVLVIGVVSPAEAVSLARADVGVVLADAGWRPMEAAVAASGLLLKVHLHIDSGLRREGVEPKDVAEAFGGLAESKAMAVAGVLTHFAAAEDQSNDAYAREQMARFDQGMEAVCRFVSGELERHSAASGAAMVLPGSRLDVVRVGIALYGLWPSPEARVSAKLVHGHVLNLSPVLSWRCPTQLVKRLPEGAFIGYGCTYRTARETVSAVLPVGYFDGYPRLLSGRAWVLIRGHRCPVMGRVMMNHIIVDVTGVLEPGDQALATLIGKDGADEVSADRIATWAQTINYEVVAGLPSHLRRMVVPGR